MSNAAHQIAIHRSSTTIWDSFWPLANAICHAIATDQPDLIVVLHKSGAVVWHAAATLWRLAFATPLPPVITANLGQEKSTRFDAEYGYLRRDEYGGEMPERIGQFVAWSARQQGWRTALHAWIVVAVGATPVTKVLVVDDVIDDGETALLALGLLWGLYPRAQTCVLAGLMHSWSQHAGWQWLIHNHFAAAEAIYVDWENDPHYQGWTNPWEAAGRRWSGLVSGIKDINEDSLDVLPLATTDITRHDLLAFLPAATWLELPQWVYATVAASIQSHYVALQAAGTELPPHQRRARKVQLQAAEKLWALAWLQPTFTLADAMRVTGLGVAGVEDLLRTACVAIECIVLDGTKVYCFTPDLDEEWVQTRIWSVDS